MGNTSYQNILPGSMTEISFSIINWHAWAPGIENLEDWYAWSKGKKNISDDFSLSPSLNGIPAMQTRRLSNLTKMSLHVALECGKGYQNIESVFASRYGEWSQTLKLLRSIAAREEISPAGFSMSVHNTAAGIYSMISHNTSAYTALAGGNVTFDTALIEAVGKLKKQDMVLLVVAEEPIPSMYNEIFPEPLKPYAVALLLGKKDNSSAIAKFAIQKSKNKIIPIHSLDFLKYLLNEKRPESIKTSFFEIKNA